MSSPRAERPSRQWHLWLFLAVMAVWLALIVWATAATAAYVGQPTFHGGDGLEYIYVIPLALPWPVVLGVVPDAWLTWSRPPNSGTYGGVIFYAVCALANWLIVLGLGLWIRHRRHRQRGLASSERSAARG